MIKKLAKLDTKLLSEVKEAFVSMPAGSDPSAGAGPVAGGSMLSQAQAAPMGAPMDPSMGGGAPPMDPSMGGGAPPMDPSMGGAPPMDPAMAGGEIPPEALAMLGGMGGGDAGGITLSVEDLIRLVEGIIAATKGKKSAPAGDPAAAGADPAAGGDPAAAGGDPAAGGGGMPPMPGDAMAGGGAMPPMGAPMPGA